MDAGGGPRPGGRRLGAAEPARRLPAAEGRRPPPCPARARDPHDPGHRSRRARRRRPRQPHAAQTRRGEPPGDPQTRMVLAGRHRRAPPQRRFPAARPLAGAEPAGQSGQRPARPHDSREVDTGHRGRSDAGEQERGRTQASQADGAVPAVAARAGGRQAQPRPHRVPPGDDHRPGSRPPRVQAVRPQVSRAALRRDGAPDPRDGRVRPAGSRQRG